MSSFDTDIEAFKAALPPFSALLGLDFGTKTIGIAISDSSMTVASPLETIKRKKFSADFEHLLALINENSVKGLVIGLPRNMDGSEGPRTQSTRAFVRNLEERLDLPMVLWDERLSTAAVERTLLEADASRKRRGEVIDKMAASFILQGALERMRRV